MIKLRMVSRAFEDGGNLLYALRDINLDIENGEAISITGESGSGKTTLLTLLGLLDSPSHGKITLFGKDVSKLTNFEKAEFRNKAIGFVFQNSMLVDYLSVYENIELPLIVSNVPCNKRKDIIYELLEKVNLIDKINSYPRVLSGGERQRVAIARALVNSPKIILADEPTGSLDKNNSIEIIDRLMELNREGRALIVITHDDRIALKFPRKITIFDGQISNDEKVAK